MNFYHVHCSIPIEQNRWGFNINEHNKITILFYSLSVAYIKRLGCTIDLYTDTNGKKLLGHLPYDNIYVVLDDMNRNIPLTNWAAGKMFAMKYTKLGEVYIDGDVFIKSEKCLNAISKNIKFDAFFAGQENPKQLPYGIAYSNLDDDSQLKRNLYEYIYYDFNVLLENIEFPCSIPKYGQNAYNGGLIVFNNQQYKDEFLNAYDYMIDKIINTDFIDIKITEPPYVCFDLITEQRFLYEIGKNYNVGLLLDYWDRDKETWALNNQCNKLGFQHVLGREKRFVIDKVKKVLKHINYDIYERSIDKLQSLS